MESLGPATWEEGNDPISLPTEFDAIWTLGGYIEVPAEPRLQSFQQDMFINGKLIDIFKCFWLAITEQPIVEKPDDAIAYKSRSEIEHPKVIHEYVGANDLKVIKTPGEPICISIWLETVTGDLIGPSVLAYPAYPDVVFNGITGIINSRNLIESATTPIYDWQNGEEVIVHKGYMPDNWIYTDIQFWFAISAWSKSLHESIISGMFKFKIELNNVEAYLACDDEFHTLEYDSFMGNRSAFTYICGGIGSINPSLYWQNGIEWSSIDNNGISVQTNTTLYVKSLPVYISPNSTQLTAKCTLYSRTSLNDPFIERGSINYSITYEGTSRQIFLTNSGIFATQSWLDMHSNIGKVSIITVNDLDHKVVL